MTSGRTMRTLLAILLLACACGDSDPDPARDAVGGDAPDAGIGDQRVDGADRDALPPDSAPLADSAADGGDLAAPDSTPPDAAPPDTNPVPSVPPLPHKTDFLNVGCRTHVYGGLNAAQRKACRDAVKQRGYTHFYLYAYNENDYGGPSFDFYADVPGFKSLLNELIADGLAPVVWLLPDDAPVIHNTSTPDIAAKLSTLVPQIDHLVSSYVLGLELDEYWPGGIKVDDLGKHLRTLTKKLIGVHQTDAKWNFAKFGWVDYMALQYGFGKTAAQITKLTKDAIAELGKPVVAAEYALDDEAKGVQLGNAAVAAGATGFGNGGTP